MIRGGSWKISGLALNELASIQNTGNPANTAPNVRASTTPAFRTSRCAPRGSMSVPRLLVSDVEEREEHREGEDDHGASRCGGELVSGERKLVGERAQHL